MIRTTLAATALGLALATACASDEDPTMPGIASRDASPALGAAVTGANLDLAGNWSWSERTKIQLRTEAVPIFGITPEGPITHLECDSWGELTIVQNGATFTGSATQSGWCTTNGGQSFDPSPVFPPNFQLVDGHLQGRSMSFTAETGAFPCPYSGSVRVRNGQAIEMNATGHCEVPRELGNDKILGWTAVRS